MRIVQLLAHSIEEYDQLKLLTSLGYDVFSIGAYIDPRNPTDDKRPALPNVTYHADLAAEVAKAPTQMWAKTNLPDAVIDWADVIICHHFEHTWLTLEDLGANAPNWRRIRHKRVIWRTVGQSVENNERVMTPLRKDGLQIVRYSPKERNIPGYCGEDALIRFYKDPSEFQGWTGEDRVVVNFTQSLKRRDPFTNYEAWQKATDGLNRMPYGPESEQIGGVGSVSYQTLKRVLQKSRVYFYTGTQPASYTLNLAEAMMTGIPVVAIGPVHGNSIFGLDLYEGHELANVASDDTAVLKGWCERLLDDLPAARGFSMQMRARALDLFGMEKIGAQWKAFLGEA